MASLIITGLFFVHLFLSTHVLHSHRDEIGPFIVSIFNDFICEICIQDVYTKFENTNLNYYCQGFNGRTVPLSDLVTNL
jgi:hypothetical protein